MNARSRWALAWLVGSLVALSPPASAAGVPDPRALDALADATGNLFTKGLAATARQQWRDGRFRECGDAFEKVAARARGQAVRRAARFRAGWCHERAHRYAEAAVAYAAVLAEDDPLSPLAALRLSVVRHEQGRADEALALAGRAAADPVLRSRARSFVARILEAAGRDRELVGDHRASRDPDVLVKVAEALGRQGDDAGRLAVLRQVYLDSPRSAAGRAARDALAASDPACFGATPPRPCLEPVELLTLAEGLYAAHASQELIDLLEPALDRFEATAPTERCRALRLIARSYDKRRRRAGAQPHYTEGAMLCAGQPTEADLLYFGGVSAYREERLADALSRFATLHQRLPDHRYNDDAALYEAAALREQGSAAKADRLLRDAIDRYADGDMRAELGWRWIDAAMSTGQTKEARRRLDEVARLVDPPDPPHVPGRLAYWRARLAEQAGRRAPAIAGYRALLREARLSYHAMLAWLRLRERVGPRRARRDLAAALTSGATRASRSAARAPALDGPAARIALLIRMDLIDEARREVAALPPGAGPDALLALAWLAHRGEAWNLSVEILRRRLGGYDQLPIKGAAGRVWRMAYPRAFDTIIRGHAAAAGIDPFLAWSIAREESSFNPEIESWANAIGLMQLLERTARAMAQRGRPVDVSPASLRHPDVNARLGVRYLDFLGERYDGHPALTIAAYNAGEARVDGWLKARGHLPLDRFVAAIPFRQTRRYTMRVLESLFRYHALHGPTPLVMRFDPLRLPQRKAPKRRRSK